MTDNGIIDWEAEITNLKLEAKTVADTLPDATRLDAWIWLDEHLQTWGNDPRMTATTLTIWIEFWKKYIMEVLA